MSAWGSIGPGTRVFSMTIGKAVATHGASRVRFEVAFSNLFNIENLDVPGTLNITSGAFGRITGELPVAEATQERLMELMTMERETAKDLAS